ncbi:MAG TPA: P-loop NTPase fold protein, partial [Longimicrobium sp.]|nr:P-loop NTPase fold protein [Longimicrobium sp.]
ETLLSRGADPKKLSAGVRRLVGESIGGARYVADTVGERDHDQLDIMREVNALATVLAARSTPLPLSIGLFGDWGSGKSFFMKKLEQQIDECSRKACEELKGLVVQARHQREKKNSMAAAQRGNGSGAAPADGDGRSTSGAEEEPLSIKLEDLKSPFCTHVVQLTFNAWHYVDTNLWASLAAAIFDGLATKLESVEALGAEEERQKLKKDLLEHTAHLRHEEERLLGRKRQLDQELRDEEAHLAHLRSEEIRLQKRISSRDVLKSAAREVLRDDKVRTAIGEIAEAAGISEKGAADSHLGERLLEMSAWRRVAWSFWKVVRRGGWMYAVLMTTSLVLLVLGLTLAGAWWPSGSAWIAGLGLGRVWSAVLAVAAAMGAAVPVLRRLSPVLEHLAVLRRKRSLELEKQRQNHLRTLDRLRDDREGVQQQISSVTREIGNLVGQLARLSPEGELAEQVRERAASSDYRRHLGVIASARADFDQLSRRLANVLDQRTLEVRGEDFPARIDRIVLYIDDLDRCPEDKVVDVLQAVHLLLAFPLFVVVVGVDSRWLLHSLRRHSAHLRGPGDANAAAADEGEEGGWRSTPQNYLEKIFQVPYTLRAMDTDGFRSLINALARPAAEEEPMESAAIETEGGPGSSSGSGGAPDAASQPGTSSRSGAGPTSPRGDTGSAGDPANGAAHDPAARSSALDAEKLELSDWEIAFMEEMHPFIGTPRAAKRFVNVYRLLRASTDRQQLQHLAGTREDGDYRAVLLLLALLTGYPAEATALLLDLADWKADQTWWEYLDRLRDATAGAEAEARFGRVEGFEAARWFRMLDQCSSLRVVVPDSLPVDAFRRWAWEVARFSFYSGRALLDRDGNGVSPAVHYATPLPAAALPPAAPASAA